MPLTIATPRTIAIAVRSERSLRPARPLSATFASSSCHLLQRRAGSSLDCERPSRPSRSRRRRGRAPGRRSAAARASCVTMTTVWPSSSTDSRRSVEDLVRRTAVEVAGRLVGEEHGRPRDERPCDRDALLLAAGELGRAVRATVGEADARDHLGHPGLVRLLARDRERQEDVLLRRQHREQIEELEDEADVPAAQLRQLVSFERRDVRAVDRRRPRRSGGRDRRGCA